VIELVLVKQKRNKKQIDRIMETTLYSMVCVVLSSCSLITQKKKEKEKRAKYKCRNPCLPRSSISTVHAVVYICIQGC
jgi:hypothetical protein